MEIIKYLAEILAQRIKISTMAARGLIKLSIRDQFGPYCPFNQINYDELKHTIKFSLKNRLMRLNISSSEDIIELLLKELMLNQSLITMSKI